MGSLKFAIDIPNSSNFEEAWVNVDYFESREKAIQFARQLFGADAEGKICVVSELPDEDNEIDW